MPTDDVVEAIEELAEEEAEKVLDLMEAEESEEAVTHRSANGLVIAVIAGVWKSRSCRPWLSSWRCPPA
jgi:hypothetical protein